MPKIKQKHADKLRNILNGSQGQLHVGIANTFDSGDIPSVSDNLDFLKNVSKDFSNFLQAHPNDLGLLVTPEWYLAEQRGGSHNANSVANNYKHDVSKISKLYPNLIYNVAGLYDKPLLKNYNDLRSHKKLQNRLGLFEALLNEPNPNLKLYTEEPRNMHNLQAGINKFWEDYGKQDWVPYFNSPSLTAPLIANNQSNYHWMGDRVGSYNKSSYADEITDPMINKQVRAYRPGNWRMKTYGNPGIPLNQASQLLCDSIHPELCADAQYPGLNSHYQRSPKKIYTLQSNTTDLRPNRGRGVWQNQRSPLSIYADNEGLQKFMPNKENELGGDFPLEKRQYTTHRNFNNQYYWPVIHNNNPLGIASERAYPEDSYQPTHQFLRFNPVRF